MAGAELIAAERRRQIEAEGWTPEHDDEHVNGELLDAAQAYMHCTVPDVHDDAADAWPWEREGFKPTDDPVPNLVRAGALIAAEIDRLNRAAGVAAGPQATPPLPAGRPSCRAQTYDTSLVCRKLAGHVGPHEWI